MAHFVDPSKGEPIKKQYSFNAGMKRFGDRGKEAVSKKKLSLTS